ncbi:TorF family putative porin [Aquipseudomonas ullengensis]|uniref:Lipoprotein n=1 Tax=Aquipseudomonas ullengensis TaxID=2759166 RepID=A0A7W4QBZ4_9GAMM|nr:TorF family putative porin [Pseudomonas ullengensis]MBB2497159.1 hypothetical protein [Pseudomonas ullengensis]
MLKKLTLAISAASTLAFSGLAVSETFKSAAGEFDVSMTATLASDYIWRGQSQTGGAGAIQGSLDVAHESGLYVGVWASNVDDELFTGNKGGADMEVDYYAGFAGSITEDVSYDLSWATYTYPQASVWNSDEVLASISAFGFTLGGKYAYDPQSKLYTYVSYDYELPYEIGLSLSYGLSDYKDPVDGADGDDKYKDWSVGLSKTLVGLDFALVYSDTDMNDEECTWQTADDGLCDAAATLSVSKSF